MFPANELWWQPNYMQGCKWTGKTPDMDYVDPQELLDYDEHLEKQGEIIEE